MESKESPHRRLLTNPCNKLEASINDANASTEETEFSLRLFKHKCNSIELIHNEYLDSVAEREFHTEFDSIKEYREKALRVQFKVNSK